MRALTSVADRAAGLLVLVIVAAAAAIALTSCSPRVVTVPFAAPCPIGYRFWMSDHPKRVGLCVRDDSTRAGR